MKRKMLPMLVALGLALGALPAAATAQQPSPFQPIPQQPPPQPEPVKPPKAPNVNTGQTPISSTTTFLLLGLVVVVCVAIVLYIRRDAKSTLPTTGHLGRKRPRGSGPIADRARIGRGAGEAPDQAQMHRAQKQRQRAKAKAARAQRKRSR